ncbi:MAG: hypothetical protein PHW46_04900, partial [Candidatus Omnitrophica bacterium]|nr:hypothetical protein [Candidatus Omnitrophota bacterium]
RFILCQLGIRRSDSAVVTMSKYVVYRADEDDIVYERRDTKYEPLDTSHRKSAPGRNTSPEPSEGRRIPAGRNAGKFFVLKMRLVSCRDF